MGGKVVHVTLCLVPQNVHQLEHCGYSNIKTQTQTSCKTLTLTRNPPDLKKSNPPETSTRILGLSDMILV
jgi:hypothetical protein